MIAISAWQFNCFRGVFAGFFENCRFSRQIGTAQGLASLKSSGFQPDQYTCRVKK
jgi:hypothetical protein